ncbi:unnamed protein product [Vitrella brassicaformis CCMP3155]|uniref:Uncharacterized protein n=1 Tax=Vitrella brassicaformis (strain CCMP3155) TaxID=1169540 RepID=A0A0G4F423_VITBC|nr:unnamed protein product [Vitrella brassicaformis CCMP3155]|eukprot:CEM06593.1 unnamed protein product [Vitrella brassicaformis CCMP3155]
MAFGAGSVHKEVVLKEGDGQGREGVRTDLVIRGVWDRQRDASFDVCVTNADAPSYGNRPTRSILATHERRKKNKHVRVCEDLSMTFTPLVVTVDGVWGREAEHFFTRLTEQLLTRQGCYLDSDLKQQNQLTVLYYVWPPLMQVQLQTDCRVRAKPYDQDNDADSVSFLIEKDKDGRLIAEYPRKLWVLVGDDSDVKPEEALRLRLEKQALRHGCAVDNFDRWHFYKYDNKTYDKAGELVHVKTLELKDESQAIVDSIMELLHRDDTRLPLQRWDDALYHNFDEDDEEA